MATVDKGSALVAEVESYIRRYVHLSAAVPGASLVLALWAIHTWLSERFPMTPYLCVSADTKAAGKTICQEVLALITRGSHSFATIRVLMLARLIETFDTRCTIYLDEAERLGSNAMGETRSVLAKGYVSGSYHGIAVGQEFKMFKVFSPKCFALIGDVTDVLRSRSIVINLERGRPAEDFRGDQAVAEDMAQSIVTGIMEVFKSAPLMVSPEFLHGRDREIWTPLWSIALHLGLDAATMDRLTAAAVDLTAAKSAPARHYHDPSAEAEASEKALGLQALAALASVYVAGEDKIASGVAVERMRGIVAGPWRMVAGRGLDEMMLSKVLRKFGVKPMTLRFGKGRTAPTAKGYKLADVVAAVDALQVAR